ncbi:MAG: hypothetical protein K9K84_06140 [Methylovulum sp.]|nr:hypothetical protein [Methylovulum sp.]
MLPQPHDCNNAQSHAFRWELSIALLIKVILLIGLWWLIFRWQDHSVQQPDISTHFALPIPQAALK